MPRSRRKSVKKMPRTQQKAVMARMSEGHRRWLNMSRRQRRRAGYLERYPVKSDDVQWKTAGGQRVARLFLDGNEMQTASIDAKQQDDRVSIFEIPPSTDPDESDYEEIIGPEWYEEGISGEVPAQNICPICHRGMKKGYCMEHGSPEAYGYSWNEKKKRWDKK